MLQMDAELVLEGQLRLYWGIRTPICFKQKDESASAMKLRHSWSVAVADDFNVQKVSDNGG